MGVAEAQSDLMPLFSGVPLQVPISVNRESEIDADQHARLPAGSKLILSGKDFILPVAVDRAENGEIRVAAGTLDDSTLQEVFALAEVEDQPIRELASLEFAERQLEGRRYLDWLKREPKNGSSRRDELEVWLRRGPQSEENFCLWWERKQERRRNALFRKAERLANCRRCGRPMDCDLNEGHRFYAEFTCQLRYCKQCGEQIFSGLFSKYMGLWAVVEKLVFTPGFRPQNVIATLDFTARNLYRMPTPMEIRGFNQDVRECVRRVTKRLGLSSDEFLFLWCDEFGGWRAARSESVDRWRAAGVGTEDFNTNLHAHGVWVGPIIPYELLLSTWIEIREKTDGARGVYIKRQRVNDQSSDACELERHRFARALGHALKYTGKHHNRADGKRLAELEIAFFGVRRVHTMGLAYDAELQCPGKCAVCLARCDYSNGHQGQHSCKRCRPGARGCPLCHGRLMYPRESGYRLISDLKREGRRCLGEVQRETARTEVDRRPMVLSGAGPRPPGEKVGEVWVD